jgi:hypothetical protein
MNGGRIKAGATEGIEGGDQPALSRVSLEFQPLRLGDFLVGTLADLVASERAGEPGIFLEPGPLSEDHDQQVNDPGTHPSDPISERFHFRVISEGLWAKVVCFLPRFRVPRGAESAG